MPPTALVVSHEASRTGAPRVAVEVVRALRAAGWRVVVVLRWGGPLAPVFRDEADAVVAEPWSRVRVALHRWRRSRPWAVRVEETAAWRVLRRERPALVWANAVLSASYVRPALAAGVPVVLHVHELEARAAEALARYGLEGSYADERVSLVACSEPVRDGLVRVTGRPAAGVTVIPSTVDAARVEELASAGGGAGGDGVVVVSCGTADAGKGVDLWLEAARLVRARAAGADVRFVWVGAKAMDGLDRRAPGGVEFVGEVDNPFPFVAAADVFCHPARRDAFPLVVLEAMALGRPVVAFAVGGVPDQVGDTGVLVPPEDVGALADALVALAGDPARRAALGEAARERARRVFGIEVLHASVASVASAAAPFSVERE